MGMWCHGGLDAVMLCVVLGYHADSCEAAMEIGHMRTASLGITAFGSKRKNPTQQN